MADQTILDLVNNAASTDAEYLETHDPSWANSRKTLKTVFMADEVADRTASDNAIIAGSGLEADGSMTGAAGSEFLTAADFAAAGLNINLKNGLILLDAAIDQMNGNLELTYIFNISSAELLALGVAVGKMGLPGAGTFYWVQKVAARNNFVSVAYATAGANGIYVRFTGATDYICHLDKTFCELGTTDKYSFETVKHALPTNTGIEVIAPDGNLINGDGSIDVMIRYVIQPDFTGVAPGTTGCCILPLYDIFVNADLSAMANLVIHHSLNTQRLLVMILDNNNTPVAITWTPGDELGADVNNYCTVPIGGPIAGNWTWMIYALP